MAAAMAVGNDTVIADWLNEPTTFVVWKSSVSPKDLMEVFTWSEIDQLAVGKARIFDWMSRLPSLDAGVARTRNGLSDCFGASSSTYTAILPLLKRVATRAESLLAVGTGSDSNPARLRAEGEMSPSDVSLIRIS